MNELELGWVVGFLEGEGSFIFDTHAQVVVSASQVQLEPLVRLQRYLGGVGNLATKQRSRYSPYNQYRLTGPRARALCEQLRPHMSPKRQGQIDSAMERWRNRPRRDGRAATLRALATKGPAGRSAAIRKGWLVRKGGADVRQLRLTQ